jgi:hypothetical protein
MASAVRNSVELLDMPLTAALRAASAEPARFLGITDRLGRLAPAAAPTWWRSIPRPRQEVLRDLGRAGGRTDE